MCKDACNKMQEAGLREGVEQLSKIEWNTGKLSSIEILNTLEQVLESYKSKETNHLLMRVEHVKEHLMDNKGTGVVGFGGVSTIKILIAEIEQFLK